MKLTREAEFLSFNFLSMLWRCTSTVLSENVQTRFGDLLGRQPFLDIIDDLHFPFGEGIDIGRILFFVEQLFGDDILYLFADIFIPMIDLEDRM